MDSTAERGVKEMNGNRASKGGELSDQHQLLGNESGLRQRGSNWGCYHSAPVLPDSA
jgi:hypothetical protein